MLPLYLPWVNDLYGIAPLYPPNPLVPTPGPYPGLFTPGPAGMIWQRLLLEMGLTHASRKRLFLPNSLLFLKIFWE